MAANLADELLQMIIAPTLTIPHDQFISGSPAAFGQNDTVSSASALLVCKRWLRVATPLLYEAIIIRSTGQSQALADAFRQNPAFAQHVKKIRLEGAYASLGGILTPCTKMNTLVILLRIYSDANVTGLCRTLPLIDPVDVIVHDEWQIDNKKIRQAFIALCDAIPKWKNLTTFEFPYPHCGSGLYKVEGDVNRQDRLLGALNKSTSIQLVSCDIPGLNTDFWQHLVRIPSITLKFRYDPALVWQLRAQEAITNRLSKALPLYKSSLEFVDISETSSPLQYSTKQEDVHLNLPSKPFSVSSISQDIWTTIFAFATIPYYPNPPRIPHEMDREITSSLDMNATRKHISLVCKTFEKFVRPLFFAFPLLYSTLSFHLFVEKVLENYDLGPQIHVLSLKELDNVQEVERDLCALIPHLTGLRHLIGSDGWMPHLSTKAFSLLAEVAGPTIRTITGLEFRRSDKPLSPAIFNSFTSLVELDIPSHPRFSADRTNLQLSSLSSLREFCIAGQSDLLDILSLMSLPQLRSVTFQSASTPVVEQFLYACGSHVEKLDFEGCADFVEVFKNAPNLRDLFWTPESDHPKVSLTLADSLSCAAAHEKLQRFVLTGILIRSIGTISREKEQTAIIRTFFESFDLSKFPSLKEIQFASYYWPIEERAISKDLLPKMAIQVKQKYGVDVTDCSGKPWRPRAQKR